MLTQLPLHYVAVTTKIHTHTFLMQVPVNQYTCCFTCGQCVCVAVYQCYLLMSAVTTCVDMTSERPTMCVGLCTSAIKLMSAVTTCVDVTSEVCNRCSYHNYASSLYTHCYIFKTSELPELLTCCCMLSHEFSNCTVNT